LSPKQTNKNRVEDGLVRQQQQQQQQQKRCEAASTSKQARTKASQAYELEKRDFLAIPYILSVALDMIKTQSTKPIFTMM
jgi:hypothetical protein